jgi:TRAP-type C4-dicarboxylate transport system permease small subunit
MLRIPYALVYAPIPIGCVLMMAEFALQTIRQFNQRECWEKEGAA